MPHKYRSGDGQRVGRVADIIDVAVDSPRVVALDDDVPVPIYDTHAAQGVDLDFSEGLVRGVPARRTCQLEKQLQKRWNKDDSQPYVSLSMKTSSCTHP